MAVAVAVAVATAAKIKTFTEKMSLSSIYRLLCALVESGLYYFQIHSEQALCFHFLNPNILAACGCDDQPLLQVVCHTKPNHKMSSVFTGFSRRPKDMLQQ